MRNLRKIVFVLVIVSVIPAFVFAHTSKKDELEKVSQTETSRLKQVESKENLDMDDGNVLKILNLSAKDRTDMTKISNDENPKIKYEAEFKNGAVVDFDEKMNVIAYSNFSTNEKVNVDKVIEQLKKAYQIDESYELEKKEDNGDTQYYWSKIGYQNVKNPYDALSIRVNKKSQNITSINRFTDKIEKSRVQLSEKYAKKIALKSKKVFEQVTSCELVYVKYKESVRLAYEVTIDNIYQVYIDVEDGKILKEDGLK